MSQINQNLLNDCFCACTWSKREPNFAHQNVYKTLRESQRRFDRLSFDYFRHRRMLQDLSSVLWNTGVVPAYESHVYNQNPFTLTYQTLFRKWHNMQTCGEQQKEEEGGGEVACGRGMQSESMWKWTCVAGERRKGKERGGPRWQQCTCTLLFSLWPRFFQAVMDAWPFVGERKRERKR